jgi:hypothetical protein
MLESPEFGAMGADTESWRRQDRLDGLPLDIRIDAPRGSGLFKSYPIPAHLLNN